MLYVDLQSGTSIWPQAKMFILKEVEINEKKNVKKTKKTNKQRN